MRILHLPVNIASQISITVRALRDIGIDAQGLVRGNTLVQDPTGVQVFSVSRQPKDWLHGINFTQRVLREIYHSDVIHWHFALPALPRSLDLKWAQWLGKPGVVEFWGSELRVPEEAERDNPYYARRGSNYEKIESRELSYARQERFAQHGVHACFALESWDRFLKPRLFEHVYHNRGRVVVSDFEPLYPSVVNSRPVLAHSPTAKVAKGTASVLAAIETLKLKYDLDFRLIHGVPRSQALKIMRTCDIFLDQFVDGTTYGLSSVEAMAFGKPVVCYIKPSATQFLPEELPVINANQDNLAEVLEPLVQNAELRHQIGKRSRKYVEDYHDAHLYAQWLVEVYKELIDKKTNKYGNY